MSDLISERAKKVEKNFQSRLFFLLYNVYGLTYTQLCDHLSNVFPHRRFSKRTICSWRDDECCAKMPSFAIMRAICDYLHVSSDYLLGLSDDFAVHVEIRKKAV